MNTDSSAGNEKPYVTLVIKDEPIAIVLFWSLSIILGLFVGLGLSVIV